MINADGTGLHRVFRPRRYEIPGLPVWSTDGTTVLFRMGNKSEMHLYAVGADGTGFRTLGDYDASFLPAWSPDRSKIAFSWNDQIYVMNVDGTDRRELTTAETPPALTMTGRPGRPMPGGSPSSGRSPAGANTSTWSTSTGPGSIGLPTGSSGTPSPRGNPSPNRRPRLEDGPSAHPNGRDPRSWSPGRSL